MNKKFTLFSMFFLVLLSIVLFGGKVFATVGGPTYISQFAYDSAKNLFYYLDHNQGGRGCPPIINAVDVVTGQSSKVKDCNEVSKEFFRDYSVENQNKYQQFISETFQNTSYVGSVSLNKNNIEIDIRVLGEKYLEKDWKISTDFVATIYQDGKELTKINFSGCDREQPHVFEGYMIPDSDLMMLVISNKSDCFEGGYIGEKVHLVKGVKYYDKNIVRGYKSSEPSEPNMGNYVLYARSQTGSLSGNIIIIPSVLLLGILVGYFIARKTRS